MSADSTETKLANRALQHCGGKRIAEDALWTENSKNASEIRDCYHSLRRAELMRNVWKFSIRTNALRPIDDDSRLVAFGTYSAVSTYAANDVVLGSNGVAYSSAVAGNIGHDPIHDNGTYWTQYFGSDVAQEYVTTWSSARTYAKGARCIGSDSNGYKSIADANINFNPVSDGGVHWVADTTVVADDTSFYAGELVYIGEKVWLSLTNSNSDSPLVNANGYWLDFVTEPTVGKLNLIYPLGSGPLSASGFRNAYRLPVGYIRKTPQLPFGGFGWAGVPTGLSPNDWQFEGNYFVTSESGVILFRFCADIATVKLFDPLFFEGLAARVALEVCEPITQSTTKIQIIAGKYKQYTRDAMTVNGIEIGPVDLPVDEYISVRA